jgi:hypothetical protein
VLIISFFYFSLSLRCANSHVLDGPNYSSIVLVLLFLFLFSFANVFSMKLCTGFKKTFKNSVEIRRG